MKLELITTLEHFDSLKDEWNSLLPDNATNEIFLTWQWQNLWWNAYCPGDLFVFSGRDDSGKLVGLAPWFVEQPSRTIRSIGCVEVTDYLDVLASPAHRESFFTAIADHLAANTGAFKNIDLCNIPGGGPTLDVLPRLLAERGFSVQTKPQEVCPIISLPRDFETYIEQLDKKNRHELRRKIRRAESSDEKVGWYIVGPEHDLDAEVHRFIDLMAASHPDKAKFLEDPKHVVFFKSIVPCAAACGWLQLSFLTVNGKPAAAYLNFDYDNRILVYNSGLVPQTYAHLSPGIVLLAYNIQHAIEHGKREFDFLRGNEEYKYRMGGKDRPVMMLEAQKN